MFISAVLVFFVSNTYTYLCFISLAGKWPELMQCWEFTESLLPPFRTHRQKKNFRKKIRGVAFTVLALALGMWKLKLKSDDASKITLTNNETLNMLAYDRPSTNLM